MNSKLKLAYYTTTQEVRDYKFFYILAISLLFTLSFVPPQDAAFSTISFTGWQPLFNSEWIGTTTAIMSTVLLSILGFYLIIDNISKEKEYRTQDLFVVSPMSNFRFLFHRTVSGSLILIFILLFSMLVSIILSIYYNGFIGTSYLEIIIPYLLIAIPSAFIIATISTFLEVLMPKKRMIRYVLFILFFSVYAGSTMLFSNPYADVLDPFGMQYSITQMMENVKMITNDQISGFSIGFSKNDPNAIREVFEYQGTNYSSNFIWSRALFIPVCLFLIWLASLFFNRLKFFQHKIGNIKQKLSDTSRYSQAQFNIDFLSMSNSQSKVSWRENLLAEIFIYQKWTSPVILILTIGLVIGSFFFDIQTAHQYFLPCIILLQVPVVSDMLTREKRLRTDIFLKTSVISKNTHLFSKGMAVLMILTILSLPIIIRLIIAANLFSAISILLGLIFMTCVSFLFGMLFQSKKPFELIMILISYASINHIHAADYLGIYNPTTPYIITLFIGCAASLVLILFLNHSIFKND